MEWPVLMTRLGEGMLVSVEIFFLTLLFSLPLGLLVAFGRMSKNLLLRNIIKLYISVMRGTPLILQLMVVYFGPYFIFGMPTPHRFLATIIAFVLNYAAYFAEIFRAGIQSIDRGQYEAAKTLGMTYVQTMRRIILPQVVRRVLPPISNETITLVKDTSLIYVLAMNDLLRTTRSLVQRDFNTTPFIVAAVFYLLMTLVLTWLFEWLERKYAVYDK